MIMPKTSAASKRKTIGLLISRVGRAWGAEFVAGVTEAAAANDLNLICFVGGKPQGIILPGALQPSYGIYDLAATEQLSGLILGADLGHGLSAQAIKTFCENYAARPAIANALSMAGIPDIIADNMGGMQNVVRHLIEDHAYRRIAFVRGPRGQIEADHRYHGYCEELKAQKIRLNEKLIVSGDFSSESGRAAVQTLLDERGQKPEAIVAANDLMAFGVLEALQLRGLQVPNDIAITGFDNVAETQTIGVPLTTVRQSFYQAGKQSVEMLIRRMNGDVVPEQIVNSTQLIIRWSCGCLPDSIHKAEVDPADAAQTGHLENKREAAIRALIGTASTSQLLSANKELTVVFGKTWDVFLDALRGKESSEVFLKVIEEMIKAVQKRGAEPATWHNVVSTLRRHALAGITNPKLTLKAENLFQQARMLTGELAQRAQAYRRLQLEQAEEVLQRFSFSMAPAMSLEEIAAGITQHFSDMGLARFYLAAYSNEPHPQTNQVSPSENSRLLLAFEDGRVSIPNDRPFLPPGDLLPQGQSSADGRYTALIMPLTLAGNRFGFMWADMGAQDLEVYTRIRNLLSSALLRSELVEQREQARREIEQLYQAEQERRRGAESLSRASRQLSTLVAIEQVPQQILEQLGYILSYERGALLLEEMGSVRLMAHHGFPDDDRVTQLRIEINPGGVYDQIKHTGEAINIGDVTRTPGWFQVDWLPVNYSWIGVPLFTKNKVTGMLSITRAERNAFNQDDLILVSTFAMQAAIALENARLYDESTRFNELLERVVAQRVEELNIAYATLEKLDKNKATFIGVAAHELRTPLTVIKGYLTMLRGNTTIQQDGTLAPAVDGVLKGADRLHQIVNSMLDVVKLDSQTLEVRPEMIALRPIVAQIQDEYRVDLVERNLTLTVEESVRALPPMMGDSQLLLKAIDGVVANAIKYTPDGGSITISGAQVEDAQLGAYAELQIKDTGIGVDPENHKIIFEKLYQLGKVELHSSGRTKFKGGGPGLGLAIAAGIVKAHGGSIWVESPGYDEEKLPGSTFFIRLPLKQAK
jgi:DNA-binding LacI/PurR family transcriptional regulator/signal transduction histidine kinase